jgi:signal transduction histidine kinase
LPNGRTTFRNTLGTIALYLESLERSGHRDKVRIGPQGFAVEKGDEHGLGPDARGGSDGCQSAAVHVRLNTNRGDPGLLAPIVPAETTASLTSSGPVDVIADPKDVFGMLLNLIHNAVGVALTAGAPRWIAVALEQKNTTVTIKITDDGPGRSP